MTPLRDQTTGLRLREEQYDILKDLEKDREQTLSQMIREAIDYWLENKEGIDR